MNDTPLHRRTIGVDSFLEDGTLRVVGRLRDERPLSREQPLLHDMELVLRVSLPDLRITQAQARMLAFPHEECPFIAPRFAQMQGLSVTRGFTRALRELFAGVTGCTHLHELARVTGPALFQARAALWTSERDTSPVQPLDDPTAMMRSLRGTCHVWAPDGPGQRKLELGWRPGAQEYPAPSVEEVRRGVARG